MRLLLIIITVVTFQTSCSQRQDENIDFLIFTSLELDKTRSYKWTRGDTLFQEIKTQRTVDYSYSLLKRPDRIELLELINRLQTTMKSDSSFEIGPEENLLIISCKKGRAFYIQDNRTEYIEFNKIADVFKRFDSQDGFQNVDLKSTFWNIEGIIEPPPPPNSIDTTKLVMPMTSAL